MYRSDDVREALRIAVQRGNDTAAWNSGMDRKQVVEEAEALFEEMVPMEPDLSYVAELVSELYKHVRSQPAAFNSYQWAQRFVWRVQVGEDSTP